eukprot:CAMPEP_0198325060 /NCGR_PEP_ID=MMETSP1450-20131203/12895_1 /TAXON_ID=753684 ORGANISM="Madagascaria erythrocladiodes, Strain CCMP3234" /NCGR_SAMPLE_ID=MMETSP1450 /ASSEMBLY_ACC=CAM_ASM_001115 /LENGTH=128 /DNA_ID=CAMNT_0044028905 /DNA_START=62 /DNA_END=448 /DNA_ORIENTATION=-
MASRQPDPQQLEQLMDLQTRAAELQRHIGQISNSLAAEAMQRSLHKVSIDYLGALPQDAPTFRTVGKAFVSAPRDLLSAEMAKATSKSLEDEKTRQKLRDQFAVKFRECQQQIDELAAQFEGRDGVGR